MNPFSTLLDGNDSNSCNNKEGQSLQVSFQEINILVKHGGSNAMGRAYMAASGTGPLVFIDDLNADRNSQTTQQSIND